MEHVRHGVGANREYVQSASARVSSSGTHPDFDDVDPDDEDTTTTETTTND